MKFLLIIVCVLCFNGFLIAQTYYEKLEGDVTFITSQNTYFKFQSTQGIQIGDTVYVEPNGLLIVKYLSSNSIMCSNSPLLKLNINDKGYINKRVTTPLIKATKKVEQLQVNDSITNFEKDSLHKQIKQQVNGSLALTNYSNLSNTPANESYSFNYTLALNVEHINSSKMSFESYISFRHQNKVWADVKSNIFNGLKIYNLSLSRMLTLLFSYSHRNQVRDFISCAPIPHFLVEK